MAARWELGAAAEAETARALAALVARGWHVRHDLALPGSRANLDHVLVAPDGTVVVLDTKRWHRAYPTQLVGGRVCCGVQDRHGQVEAVVRYAARVAKVLGLPAGSVWPLLVVHGSPVAGGYLTVPVAGCAVPVYVLGAEMLLPTMAAAPRGADRRRAAAVAARVDQVLHPYA